MIFALPTHDGPGPNLPVPEINATAYLNLLRGDWLRRLPGLAETLLLVLAGAMAGFGLGRLRPMKAAGVAVLASLLVVIVAAWSAWQLRVWFPWLVVSAVQVPVALGCSVLVRTARWQRDAESGWRVEAESAAEEPQVVSPRQEFVPSAGRLDARPAIPEPVLEPHPPVPDHVLLRCVGNGAYGEVWLARDAIGTHHAVKIVYRGRFPNAAPFEREFKGIQRFTPISRSHQGFVHVLHVGRNDERGYFYYIMELGDDVASGQQIDPRTYAPKNLAKVLEGCINLPVPECVEIMLSLAAALDYLHQQRLIHRDIKPSNIIFMNGQPKLADIGLVTEMESDGQDVSDLGTKGYIAPEGPGTAAADVYSLGKVLYEMSMGRGRDAFPELPTNIFDRADQSELMQLNRIILKACENDPARRYQTAAELRADLLAQWPRAQGVIEGRE